MNKKILLVILSAVFTLTFCITAFASPERRQFREEKQAINAQIQAVNEEIKAVKAQNKVISEKFKAIRQAKKETGVLSIDKENFQKAVQLRKEITAIEVAPAADVKAERARSKELISNEDYEAAKDALCNVLEIRKAQLEAQKKRNAIWLQIDALLNF